MNELQHGLQWAHLKYHLRVINPPVSVMHTYNFAALCVQRTGAFAVRKNRIVRLCRRGNHKSRWDRCMKNEFVEEMKCLLELNDA